MKHMKFLLPLLLLSGALSSVQADSVKTVPVGVVNMTIPAGTASNPTVAVLAMPLQNEVTFSGLATAVDASTVSFDAPGWTTDEFAAEATPYGLFTTADSAYPGKCFLITANTANTLTVDTASEGLDLTDFAAINDRLVIRRLDTLGSAFGTTEPVVYAKLIPSQADNILIQNGTSWETYWHNETGWKTYGTAEDQNNKVIKPDQGILLLRRDTTDLDLSIIGTVADTNVSSYLASSGLLFLGNPFPVETKLVDFNLHSLPGWVSNNIPTNADRIYIRDASSGSWKTFWHNNTEWRTYGTGEGQDEYPIAAGQALLIERSSAAANSDIISNLMPYSLD